MIIEEAVEKLVASLKQDNLVQAIFLKGSMGRNENDEYSDIDLYHLIGEIRSDLPSAHRYEVYEQDHSITLEYWGGYVRHNRIHRKVFDRDNEQLRDEFITENHAIMMYEPLLEQQIPNQR